MDIDHFKHVNDTYGHDVGDMVLRETVDIVKENLGPMHVFGRWGGEEKSLSTFFRIPTLRLPENMLKSLDFRQRATSTP